MRNILRLLSLGGLLLVPSAPRLRCLAQSAALARATLRGTVTDPTGARMPHATVVLTGRSGRSQQFTQEDGNFQFAPSPGTYTLTVAVEGFALYTSAPLHLVAGSPLVLPVRLAIATRNDQVSVGAGGLVDPGGSGAGMEVSGAQLDMFSSDPQAFQQELNALAGPGLGGGGAQILVNGFSGNRLPPKSSIRAIHIGQNPYSAYYDAMGFGRIEIDTKPSTDKLHGELAFSGTDQPLDTRNPYDQGPQPPFFQFGTDGQLTGPINAETSYLLSEDTQQLGNNATVNATVLDAALVPFQLSEEVVAPQHTYTFAGRIDHQFSKTHYAYLRDEWTNTAAQNAGLGGTAPQSLPAAGYTSGALTNTLQGTDTVLLGSSGVNEFSLQYLRTRTSQLPNSQTAAVVVEGSFQAGGSVQQVLHDNQDRYEIADRVQFEHGAHSLQFGFRFRALRAANLSTGNFNGLYTFPSIAAYQATLAGAAQGLSPAQIRAAGGGAAQFNLTVGDASATLQENDYGVFAEDDWQIRRGLTLSYGFRFEGQSAIPDHTDPAPRFGLAWSVFRGKKPAPLFTVHTGYGIFYNRFPAPELLQAIRQNGTAETAYFVQNPDTYPAIPPAADLQAGQPTVYRVNPALRTSYDQVGSVGVDHVLGHHGRISVLGIYLHGTHGYLTRNLNAPLPGTGLRPLGTAEDLYQYSSDSNENDEYLNILAPLRLPHSLLLYNSYTLQRQKNESDGIDSFPSNQYDLRADYGRAPGLFAQTQETVLFWRLPHGFTPGLYFNAHSGAPFNITTGTDLNGDTIFNDRPAFATDLSRPSVVRTALGNFDTVPLPGERLVGRNSGTGPDLLWVDLQLTQGFHIGPRSRATASNGSAGPAAGGPAGKPDRPWALSFKLDALNLTNRNNPGVPVGVLGLIPCPAGAAAGCTPSASPNFGHALSLASDFSPLTASNRTVMLRSSFSF